MTVAGMATAATDAASTAKVAAAGTAGVPTLPRARRAVRPGGGTPRRDAQVSASLPVTTPAISAACPRP